MMRRFWLVGLVAVMSAMTMPVARATAADPVLAALQSGAHVLLLRHGRTSAGGGDPQGFRLEDCASQRNLSDDGRKQAAAMGRKLAEAGVVIQDVLSSRWCRALETARLGFARATPWESLDSILGNRADEPARTAAVRRRIGSWKGPGTLVLVTHQVNISAITGEFTSMGEALVLAPDGGEAFKVVGRMPF